jgi:hypothetical protein
MLTGLCVENADAKNRYRVSRSMSRRTKSSELAPNGPANYRDQPEPANLPLDGHVTGLGRADPLQLWRARARRLGAGTPGNRLRLLPEENVAVALGN